MTVSDHRAAVLAGLGTCLPRPVVSNADLALAVPTSDEWIRSRTGIAARRRLPPTADVHDLALAAAANALAATDGEPVDALVLATSTPKRPLPGGAPEIAHRLGLGPVPAFDLQAMCSGFVYALATATGLISGGVARRVLVVAAEAYSRIVDPQDRGTAVIFGDGAGAVVLRAGAPDEPGAVLALDLGSDGSARDLIHLPGSSPYLAMEGRQVYRHAVDRLAASALAVIKDCGWTAEQVDTLVPHQANARIIEAVAQRLALPAERAVCAIAEVGNTAAASIPLALAEAVDAGALQPGHRTVLTAFGGGLTWGSAALRWPTVRSVRSEL
ncbi:beta-ketoacyl-ACP synthase III [Crossiella cryophila]|uniref:Beta-ketoacyl-[acyl-carrier-protein] synthase III n=1 Tax=Crossiella cryophila TaxID=43355 RepID=A0A7W7CBT9_9PSEU|nr:beta-ketoacyl-ACP synthase III [Crossiella cryophila]MBB4678267.1 3-oxoacyl-[acyl-carrier-protein] synthase-3 [Crossiella cryophila]